VEPNRIDTNRIQFMDCNIDSLTAAEAKECLDRLVNTEGNHYVVTPNADIVVKMHEDPELKDICNSADLILTDGQTVVTLSKWLGTPIKERVCMTDFVWDVCDLAHEKGYKLCLFGGREEVLAKTTARLKKEYPDLAIVESYSPPFGFEKDEAMLAEANERIRNSGADILIVFLGCPKQEKFIAKNKDIYNIPVSITMGGCVDFLAGTVRRAPVWVQKAGFEWFYRFLQEPRRMYRRYFIDDMKIFKLYREYKKAQKRK